MKQSRQTQRFSGWRLIAGLAAASLLLPGLGLAGGTAAQAAKPGPRALPSVPAVPPQLASAPWKESRATKGGPAGALSAVRLAPGGSAVWGAQITAGAATLGTASLQFSGLPAAISVTPADVPTDVPAGDAVVVEGCSRSGNLVDCTLRGGITVGQTAFAGVKLTAAPGLGAGTPYQGSVRLVAGGNQTDAVTGLSVAVDGSAKDSLYVNSVGTKLIRVGTSQKRVVNVYNLGGGGPEKRAGSTVVGLKNVLPATLTRGVKATGKGWKCSGGGGGLGSCSWQGGGFGAGGSTAPLTLKYKVAADAHLGLRQKGGAHRLDWVMQVSGDSTMSPLKHSESVQLVPPLKKGKLAKKKKDKPAEKKSDIGPRKADLSLTSLVIGHSRLGGLGRYRLSLINGGGATAKGTRVQISPPSHAVIKTIHSAKGWRCSKKGGVCVLKGVIKSHEGPAPIEFSVQSRAKTTRAAVDDRLTAIASWADHGKRGHDRVVVSETWDPALSVSAKASSDVVHVGLEKVAPGTLSAQVDGLAGRDFTYAWRQVCPKRARHRECPQVTWIGAPSGSTPNPELAMTFNPPAVAKKTELLFELRVAAAGAVVKKRVSVTAIPVERVFWEPNLATSQPGANPRVPKYRPRLDRDKLPGAAVRATSKVQVSGKGPSRAVPGKPLTLKANIKLNLARKRGRVVGVRWFVNGEPSKLLKGAKRTNDGRTITFRVPQNARKSLLVSVLVKHPGGVTTAASELINVVPGKAARTAAVGAAPKQPVEPAPGQDASPTSRAASSAFCDIYGQAGGVMSPIGFDGVTLTLGQANAVGSGCSDPIAAVNFSGAGMTINGIGFTGLSGSITATGITVSAGTVSLPTGVTAPGGGPIPDAVRVFAFTPQQGTSAFTVPFANGVLSGLTGTAAFVSLPYLPLPAGWTASSSVTLGPGPGGGYQASIAANATGANGDGAASVAGDVNTDGSFNLSVAVTNLWMLTATNGSSATFSGSGTIAYTPGQPIAYNVAAQMITQGTGYPITGGVTLSNASVTWNNSGFAVAATALVPIGGVTYSFAVAGTLTDFTNWSLTVTSNYNITLRDLQINAVSGSISMSNGSLTIDVSAQVGLGSFTGLAGVTITSAEAHFTNVCDPTDTNCDPTKLGLQLDIVGSIVVGSDNIAIDTTVDVNIATGDYTLEAEVGGAHGFGPAELNLSGVAFFVTNDAKNEPLLTGSPCLTSTILAAPEVIGFTAQYSPPGGGIGNLTGVYDPAQKDDAGNTEYCLSASSFNGLPPTTGGGDSYPSGLGFIYSTYQTNLTVGGVVTPIPPKAFTLYGTYGLPTSVQKFFDNKVVAAEVIISMTRYAGGSGDEFLSNFTLTGDLVFNDVYIAGDNNPGNTSLKLQTAGLTISKTGPQWAFGINATVDLHTPGSPTGTSDSDAVVAADVPMTASLLMDVGGTGGFGLTFKAQIGDGATIPDAFGFQGFDLQEFKVQATITVDEVGDSFGVGASVMTPKDSNSSFGSLTSALGFLPGVEIAFAFNLSASQPCFAVSIGDPSGKDLAINWGGIIEADFAKFVFAPNGCPTATIPMLSSGYAFDFDGSILGTAVAINGAISFNSAVGPTGIPGGPKLFGCEFDLDIGSFSLAGVDVQETKIHLLYSTIQTTFQLSFSGGINIWGVIKVSASGLIDIGWGVNQSIVEVALTGSQSENLLGLFKDSMNFSFDAKWNGISAIPGAPAPGFQKFDVSASGEIKVLIIDATASVAFDYSNGIVNKLAASFSVELDLYIVKGSVAVSVDYERPATGDDGKLYFDAQGTGCVWFFGYRCDTITVVDTSWDIHFDNPVYPAPAPVVYPLPPLPTNAPPPNSWDEGTLQWQYSAAMFSDIPWDSGDLAAAVGSGQYANPAALTPLPAGDTYAPSATINNPGTATFGNGDSQSETYVTANVTVYLPRSWGAVQLNNTYPNLVTSEFNNPADVTQCYGGTTKTMNIRVPKWSSGYPTTTQNAAFIIAEVNWRLYLASQYESAQISGFGNQSAAEGFTCGYDQWDTFPSLEEWFSTNLYGQQVNISYPTTQADGAFNQQCLDAPVYSEYGSGPNGSWYDWVPAIVTPYYSGPLLPYWLACNANLGTWGVGGLSQGWAPGWNVSNGEAYLAPRSIYLANPSGAGFSGSWVDNWCLGTQDNSGGTWGPPAMSPANCNVPNQPKGTGDQAWYYQGVGGVAGPITNSANGQCLDQGVGFQLNGSSVTMATTNPCNGSANQQWVYNPALQQIQGNGVCLAVLPGGLNDYSGRDSGADIVAVCDPTNAAQQFTLTL